MVSAPAHPGPAIWSVSRPPTSLQCWRSSSCPASAPCGRAEIVQGPVLLRSGALLPPLPAREKGMPFNDCSPHGCKRDACGSSRPCHRCPSCTRESRCAGSPSRASRTFLDSMICKTSVPGALRRCTSADCLAANSPFRFLGGFRVGIDRCSSLCSLGERDLAADPPSRPFVQKTSESLSAFVSAAPCVMPPRMKLIMRPRVWRSFSRSHSNTFL